MGGSDSCVLAFGGSPCKLQSLGSRNTGTLMMEGLGFRLDFRVGILVNLGDFCRHRLVQHWWDGDKP